jgi:hypothetical protein
MTAELLAFALVYTGEHFVIDELAGWCCAIAVYFVGSRRLSWRQAAGLRRVTRADPVLARAGR